MPKVGKKYMYNYEYKVCIGIHAKYGRLIPEDFGSCMRKSFMQNNLIQHMEKNDFNFEEYTLSW